MRRSGEAPAGRDRRVRPRRGSATTAGPRSSAPRATESCGPDPPPARRDRGSASVWPGHRPGSPRSSRTSRSSGAGRRPPAGPLTRPSRGRPSGRVAIARRGCAPPPRVPPRVIPPGLMRRTGSSTRRGRRGADRRPGSPAIGDTVPRLATASQAAARTRPPPPGRASRRIRDRRRRAAAAGRPACRHPGAATPSRAGAGRAKPGARVPQRGVRPLPDWESPRPRLGRSPRARGPD
ncbi:hypothetical protein CHKEEEPN_4178 [Methylorubrum podarium]|nr:hypothetical protein CHKEEEPN_4178 [Methylorubrum podarium]